MIKKLVLSCILLISFAAIGADYDEKLRDDLRSAEHAILSSLVLKRSTQSKYLCATNLYACSGVDQAELGMAVIGGSKSKDAPLALVNLVRYRLDAGLSTEFNCYVSYRGKSLAATISSVNSNKLHAQCVEELDSLKRRARGKYDASDKLICRSPTDITAAVSSLKSVAQSAPSCN